MRIITVTFFLIFIAQVKAITNKRIDSLINELEKTIQQKDYYFNKKLNTIQQLQNEARRYSDNPEQQYSLYVSLLNQFESFNYDSAFKYAVACYQLAKDLNNPEKVAMSKIKLGFVLLSSGMFKEAIDSLNSVNYKILNRKQLANYYSILARSYYDLADYTRDGYYSSQYMNLGNTYQALACSLVDTKSFEYWKYYALLLMKKNDWKGSRNAFEYQISRYHLDDHEFAIAASSLAYVYSMLNERNHALEMMIKAAIADIRSSTKETVALRNLSNLLFEQGDVKTAYRYIKLSLDDATYYNARHRKIEIASILPIIEGEKLNTVEKQKKIITLYAVVISLLTIVVILFLYVIFRQLKRLKLAKQQIQDAYQSLTEANKMLQEANKIKEEYIGYYFNITSEYIDKLEKFQRDIHRKLVAGKIDELKHTIQNIDLKKEKEELYHNFDRVFLKLFPDFIKEYNKLFREEDRIILSENELLTTEMRIFALIRMGISDNEKIARILQYSVNTIYTYKTKVKNKSIVPNEEFEERIMAIKSV